MSDCYRDVTRRSTSFQANQPLSPNARIQYTVTRLLLLSGLHTRGFNRLCLRGHCAYLSISKLSINALHERGIFVRALDVPN